MNLINISVTYFGKTSLMAKGVMRQKSLFWGWGKQILQENL